MDDVVDLKSHFNEQLGNHRSFFNDPRGGKRYDPMSDRSVRRIPSGLVSAAPKQNEAAGGG